MPNNRSFASCVFYNHKIYVFGGYDQQTKTQLGSCLSYDIHTEKWHQLADLRQLRSQACACRVNDTEILIFGGYNKLSGTLDTIERYNIAENKYTMTSNNQVGYTITYTTTPIKEIHGSQTQKELGPNIGRVDTKWKGELKSFPSWLG